MRKSLLILLLLTGCGAGYQAAENCQKQAGPMPSNVGDYFGVVGAAAASQADDRQAWGKRVDDCMAAWRAKRDAQNSNTSNPN